jgi:hypothetical protein
LFCTFGHNLTTPFGTMSALYSLAPYLATNTHFCLILKAACLGPLYLEIRDDKFRKRMGCMRHFQYDSDILLTNRAHYFPHILTIHPIDDRPPAFPAADVHDHLKSSITVQVHSFCKSIGIGIGHLKLRIG